MPQLVIGILFVLLFITGKNTVQAQPEPPLLPFDTPSPVPDPNQATPVTPLPTVQSSPNATPVVVGGNPESERLNNFQKEYLLLLEQYRAQEQNYIVTKAQYKQLNTLASQELAVQETKKLINIRADIFIIYLDMLQELLNQTKGVPLENKSPQLVKLRLLREAVLQHKTTNNSALDRFAVDQESLNFSLVIETIESEAYYTLSLIRVGRVQLAYDKLLSVRQLVEESVIERELSSAQRAQKERGFNEIDLEIDNTTALLAPIKQEVLVQTAVRELGDFSGLTSKLNPVFAGMNQTIRYLQEIRK